MIFLFYNLHLHSTTMIGWRLWRYRPTSPEGVLVASWLCSAIRRSSCNPSLAPSLTRKVAMSGRSIIFFDCIFRLCRSYHLCVVAYVVVNSLGRWGPISLPLHSSLNPLWNSSNFLILSDLYVCKKVWLRSLYLINFWSYWAIYSFMFCAREVLDEFLTGGVLDL